MTTKRNRDCIGPYFCATTLGWQDNLRRSTCTNMLNPANDAVSSWGEIQSAIQFSRDPKRPDRKFMQGGLSAFARQVLRRKGRG